MRSTLIIKRSLEPGLPVVIRSLVPFAWSSRGTHSQYHAFLPIHTSMTTTNETSPTASTTLDQIFTCLSHSTRRRILVTLAADNSRDQEEFESRDFNSETEELERFRTELYHRHFPFLEERGYISWDRDVDIITRGPHFEEVRPLVELMHIHRDELPQNWP